MSWADQFRVRQYVKGSLWILPLLGCLFGALIGQLDLLGERSDELPTFLTYTPSTASGVLTAIVGAMVGLLGFVVTIGVLVVQTATGTLSPRFMRIWYRDRLQKIVLAAFAGTFTFAFALLRRITDTNVPDLGVTLAGFMVTVSLLLLLLYLDRFTHALRPVAVGALVARQGLRVVAESTRFTEATLARPAGAHGLGEGAATAGPIAAVPPRVRDHAPAGSGPAVVCAQRSGVLQAVHLDGLVAWAVQRDCTLVLTRSPGDFVASGTPVIDVYGADPDPARLLGMIALGRERTIDQDPAFALRILVDIAIRALSPAVNDPTTAVQMIDQIELFLLGVALAGPGADTWTLVDGAGAPRLVVPARRFETYLQLGLTEIMGYGSGSTQVCRRLSAMLETLATTGHAAHRPVVARATKLLDDHVRRHFPRQADFDFVRTIDRQGIGGPAATLPE